MDERKDAVILVLFDAASRQAFWLAIKEYFREDDMRQPRKETKTVRVRVPKRQRVNEGAIAQMRRLLQGVVR